MKDSVRCCCVQEGLVSLIVVCTLCVGRRSRSSERRGSTSSGRHGFECFAEQVPVLNALRLICCAALSLELLGDRGFWSARGRPWVPWLEGGRRGGSGFRLGWHCQRHCVLGWLWAWRRADPIDIVNVSLQIVEPSGWRTLNIAQWRWDGCLVLRGRFDRRDHLRWRDCLSGRGLHWRAGWRRRFCVWRRRLGCGRRFCRWGFDGCCWDGGKEAEVLHEVVARHVSTMKQRPRVRNAGRIAREVGFLEQRGAMDLKNIRICLRCEDD